MPLRVQPPEFSSCWVLEVGGDWGCEECLPVRGLPPLQVQSRPRGFLPAAVPAAQGVGTPPPPGSPDQT